MRSSASGTQWVSRNVPTWNIDRAMYMSCAGVVGFAANIAMILVGTHRDASVAAGVRIDRAPLAWR